MYKKRFTAWKVSKYDTRKTIAALAQTIQMRKKLGKESRIRKSGAILPSEKIEAILRKGLDENESLLNLDMRSRLPTNVECDTPPLGPDKPEGALTQRDGIDAALCMNLEAEQQSHVAPQFVNFTEPKSMPDATTPLGNIMWGPEDAPGRSPYVENLTGYEDDRTSNSSGMMDPSLEFDSSGETNEPMALDISQQAVLFCNPDSSNAIQALNSDFHNFLAAKSRNSQDVPNQHESRLDQDALQMTNNLATSQDPVTYVSLCYLSCILQGQGKINDSRIFASQASDTFGALIREQNEQALISLNIVLAVLFCHGQTAFATELVKDAKAAALAYLSSDDHIVTIIELLLSQVTMETRERGPSVAKLRSVYEDFQRDRGPDSHYTLIARYHLAWRLSLEDEQAQVQAYQMLISQQKSVDEVFGKTHMQTIGNLVTTSRILQTLEQYDQAEISMREAITRIEQAYNPSHPYALEMKRRHAELLRVSNLKLAEEKLIEVALDRIGVLGADNELSVESINDVKDFLYVIGREEEFASFEASVDLAVRTRSRRNPLLAF